MKILSIEHEENMIKVITDNTNRPEFVYIADKFESLEQLETEINKSIALEDKRKVKKDNRISALINELEMRKEV